MATPEKTNDKDWWLNELQSLGIKPHNEVKQKDIQQLEDIADDIKQDFFKEYKKKTTQ
jgi:hypothetical protein